MKKIGPQYGDPSLSPELSIHYEEDGQASKVIPFGKYKGQPVTVLASDKGYLDWLMGQSWFRERFGGIYQIVINNFAEPNETPEHNALQVRFLDDGFCYGLLYLGGWNVLRNPLEFVRARWHDRFGPKLARLKIDISELTERKALRPWNFTEEQQIVRNDGIDKEIAEKVCEINGINEKIEGATSDKLESNVKARFEVDGWDVVIDVFADDKANENCGSLHFRILVEIKISLGDDYPAVLRQIKSRYEISKMKQQKRYSRIEEIPMLVIKQLSTAEVTIDQIRKIFTCPIVFMDHIEESISKVYK